MICHKCPGGVARAPLTPQGKLVCSFPSGEEEVTPFLYSLQAMNMEIHSAPYINEPQLHSLRSSCKGSSRVALSWKHTGDFKLSDYEEVGLEIAAARIVRKR